ncbi:MAG TPA: protein kinase [Candidatus Melainabacteria bacterium]|nr:protein kinase [Candidatus Melainabacteria bacterium]
MKIPQDTPTPELDGRGGSYLAGFDGLEVDSRYQIVELIARGGMGSVYKALDTKLDRKVALKFIAADYVNDKTALRFQREARATSALDNNHIVRIYDFGTADNGTPYMVMEYARGKTLHQLLKKHGKLGLEDTLAIAENICLAMVHAHDRNIIHRDLKPGNIMVSRQDEELSAKGLDFGLSSIIEDNRQFLTGTGLVVGSPRYLSPEQARGEEADHRSDVYSLACAIYECLAGRGPFEARNSFELIKKHIEEDAPPMVKLIQASDPQAFSDLSDSARDALDELARVLAICLNKNPDDRYQNMNELLLDIRTIRKTLQDAINRDTSRTCSLFEEEDLTSTTSLDGIPAVLDNIAPASEKKARGWLIWVVAALGIAAVGLAVTASVYLLGPSPIENTGSLTRETDILSIPNAQVHSDKSGATVGDFHGTVDTEALKKSVKGDRLEVVGINLNDDQVAFVAERPLRRFCIRETVITSDQVKVLARSNSIKELIAKYSNIDDQGVAALTRMTQLRKLNLQGSEKLTGECLKTISANFPELYNLDVGHSGIKGRDLVYLTGPRHLTNLDLQELKLRDQDIKPLLKLPSLRAIDLTDNRDLTEKTLEQFGQATINNGARYKINIKRCPAITAELAAKYQTKYPGLKIESTN